MAKMKLGWHTGPTGIGVPQSFWSNLNTLGIAAVAKGADTMSGVFDLQQIAKTSIVPHVCVWRRSNTSDYSYDTPNYNLSPKAAADLHWAKIKTQIPPELDKSITWIEVINEPDKNKADWLGYFSYEIAILANLDGYKILSFGWSGGEPEPSHWFTDGIVKYLNYCADNPGKAGISVHEYNFGMESFESVYPWLIGRFEFIHLACDANNIPYPPIVITEFGFAYNDIPDSWPQIEEFLFKSCAVYAQYPNVLGAALWYLGGNGWDNIYLKWQPHIPKVEQLMASTVYPDPEIPDPPVDPQPEGEAQITIEIENDYNTSLGTWDAGDMSNLTYRYKYENGESEWFPLPVDELATGIEITATATNTITLTVVDGGEVPEEPTEPTPPPVPVLSRGDMVIDVSHWNGTLNWDNLKANGVKGAIIRASNGIIKNGTSTDADGVDHQYWRNVAECTRLNIPFGVYHFLNGNYNALQQVQHFGGIIAQTIAKNSSPTLVVALDAEPADVGGTPASESFLVAAGGQLLTELNALGLLDLAGWYSRKSWWDTVVSAGATWPKQFLSWVALWPTANPISSPPSINTVVQPMRGFDKVDYWQFTSVGGQIFNHTTNSLDVNYYYAGDPVIQPPPPPPPPPPPVTKIDLLPYFIGSGSAKGRLYEVETRINGVGAGQQRHQTHVNGSVFYHTKGGDGTAKKAQWEELSYDDTYIRRYRDTSMSETQFYILRDVGVPFSKWCPRYMAVGEVYQRSPDVTVYNKSNCATPVTNTNGVVSWIKFVAKHATLTAYNSIVVSDVIELHWLNSSTSTSPIEVYYYSKDPRFGGLVGWKHENKVALPSEIHEPGQRPDSFREANCLD